MAGTKGTTGIAKSLLVGLVITLACGIAGSLLMGIRARDAEVSSTVDQARTIADNSLTLLLHPSDLSSPATHDRAATLRTQVTGSVLDTSQFTSVTLWSPEGRILFSTDTGRIGTSLPGETNRIKAAIKDTPQTRDINGVFSVMTGFHLPSGVGNPAAVELTRADGPIASAEGPWRTNALFMALLLAIVGLLLIRVQLLGDAIAASAVFARSKEASGSSGGRGRALDVPTPGIREEADARRKAEDRAKGAESRLTVVQEQYRKTLEELHSAQIAMKTMPRSDHDLEERALRAEGRARTLQSQVEALSTERDKIMQDMLEITSHEPPPVDPAELGRLRQIEQETIGLRAELEGAQAQLGLAKRELDEIPARSTRAAELQEDLDAAHVDALHSREAAETAQSELRAAQTELDDARTELRALRNEEQRAAMLEDELNAARAQLESLAASQRAELVERESDLEEKVRAAREEFQSQLELTEASYREQLGRGKAELAEKIESMKRELGQREELFGRADERVEQARADAEELGAKLFRANEELASTREELTGQSARADELSSALAEAHREAGEATTSARNLATQLEDATQSNADLNRRLQELEARRALEVADSQGLADLDEILRVTQERLAGQTEKLIGAEERVHDLERELTSNAERLEQVEAELRQQHMSEAMRQLRTEGHESQSTPVLAEGEGEPEIVTLEDRRAAAPFLKELSDDAKRSLSQIMGVTQILKHQKNVKEQAQLIRQLTNQARRLDHTVTDLVDADRLARGTVDVNVKRTDLQALVERVIEESGVKTDHEVRVEAESMIVAVDQRRTEQILAALIRSSGERTSKGRTITVKLAHVEGGAMITIEDPEPVSDRSLSPVVRRFAEIQGGWARAEQAETGSTLRVYLPDGGPDGTPARPGEDADLKIVVEEPWDPGAEQILVQELHRLSTAEE